MFIFILFQFENGANVVNLNKFVFLLLIINFFQISINASEASSRGDSKRSVESAGESKSGLESKLSQESKDILVFPIDKAPEDYADFLKAIIFGDLDKVIESFKVVPKTYINAIVEGGQTPLEWAISSEASKDIPIKLKIINLLIENGAIITREIMDMIMDISLKMNPINYQFIEDNINKIEKQLSAIKYNKCEYLLKIAIKANSLNDIEKLLRNCPDLDIDIMCFLQKFAHYLGNNKALELFLEFTKNMSALFYAIWINDRNTLDDLLKNKLINVNYSVGHTNYTPLNDATSNGNIDAIKMLLAAGANPNLKKKWSPIEVWALKLPNRRIDIAKLLLDAGADPNVQSKSGNTVLMDLIIGPAERLDKETVLLLLEKGADLFIKNANGETALSLAKKFNVNKEIQDILERAAASQYALQYFLRHLAKP